MGVDEEVDEATAGEEEEDEEEDREDEEQNMDNRNKGIRAQTPLV